MRCIVCHSSSIEVKRVNEEIKVNSDIIYVPVSIPVCNNCGERYYDRKALQYLEQTREKLKDRKLTIKQIGRVMSLENE